MIKFGIKGFKCPTPATIKKVSLFIESILATVAGSVLLASRPQTAAILLLIAGGINKFFDLFYENNPSDPDDSCPK